MFRIFLPLFLFLTVFLVGFVLAIEYLPDIILSKKIDQYEDKLTRGSFYLLDKKLKGLSNAEQQKALHNLQEHFGYPLQILEPENVLINKKNWTKINAGESLHPDIDDANYNISRLQDSGSVLAIAFSESQTEEDHKQAQGTFYLLEQELLKAPQTTWVQLIKNLQPHFGFPISLVKDSELSLSSKQKILMENGKVIALDHNTNRWRFFGKLKNSPYTLQFGPIKQPISLMTFMSALLGVFLASLATALLLWLRPLWLSIKNISQTADDFGRGELTARTDIKKTKSLGKLAQQFNTMADRVSHLVTGHRELTNAVSHELRTPIARMRFGLDMLSNSNEDSRERYLGGLNSDVDELEDLVNELLRYARFERLKTTEDFETIEVIPWLENIIEQTSSYMSDKTFIHFFNGLPLNLTTQINPRHFARAIHNLLRNASLYGNQTISLSLFVKKDLLQIRIEDDGIGIPVEDRERIFNAFTRLDISRHRKTGGHGLGLAITKKIIEAHQGSIHISDSRLGGACFTLSWPIYSQT